MDSDFFYAGVGLAKKIPTTKRFNNKHKTTNRTLRRTRIPLDVGNFGGVIRIGVFDPEGIFNVLGIERGYCTSGLQVSPAVFGVECRVYCCDNRRRFAGCAEDWKAIMVGNVRWQR